jgi:hypothetical protein
VAGGGGARDAGGQEVARAEQPDASRGETSAPGDESHVRHSQPPDTRARHPQPPDTHAPDTHAPDTHAPDTHAPAGWHARPDAGPTPHGSPVEIVVNTDPPGGELVTDGGYGGSDGTHISRAQGTVLRVSCKQETRDGKVLASGRVTVRFDGTSHIAICHMRPPGKCVKGLKNPLADCPD